MAAAEARLPNLLEVDDCKIRYSKVDRRSFEKGATPSSISMSCMDSSYHLEKLLNETYKNNHRLFLGELQLSFVSFLISQNYDSFEQWKKLTELLCSCDTALTKYSQLFLDFLQVFYYQLKEVPQDFFVDIVSSQNFLTVILHRFFQNVVSSSDAPESLKRRATKFQKHVTEHFKWDFDTEAIEDQPVVVELE